jgi:hypothetical protein
MTGRKAITEILFLVACGILVSNGLISFLFYVAVFHIREEFRQLPGHLILLQYLTFRLNVFLATLNSHRQRRYNLR